MDKPLTLVEHLAELRKRIIVLFAALVIASVLSFPFAEKILAILKLPASSLIERLAFFSPQEAFLIYLRIAFLSGCVISMPVAFYHLWAFVFPAIGQGFKKRGIYFIVLCVTAFILGGLFAYFILIPRALGFLLSFAGDQLQPVISASKYVSFVTGLILGSGLIFEMPVLSFILTKLGVINNRALRKKYKYAIVAIFVIAAIITPTTDVFNMLILALPMLFLYEVSIWISFLVNPADIRNLPIK